MLRYARTLSSPIGRLYAVSDGESLSSLAIEGQRDAHPTPGARSGDCPLLDRVERWLAAFFAGERPLVDFVLAPQGSAFQRRVWEILREIPYGQTTTYGAIARRVAAETGRERLSAQAVGGAVGRNPISIIIPCHRVVGSNGNLTGYAGGLPLKIALLQREGVDMGRFFLPKRGAYATQEDRTLPKGDNLPSSMTAAGQTI